MADFRKNAQGRPESLETYRPGANVSVEEIHRIMADNGYSAGARSGWLKTLLTDITSEAHITPDKNRDELVRVVKDAIEANQDDEPIAKDTL